MDRLSTCASGNAPPGAEASVTDNQSTVAHFSSYYRWVVASDYLGLPQRFEDNVLDIGAGNGHFLSRIEAPLKIGIDLCVPESRLATLVQADACRLPYTDGVFGHAFAFDILEHVPDDQALIGEALRVLTAEGVLWLSTPADQFFLFPGRLALQRMSTSWGHVRRGYSPEDLMGHFSNVDVDVTLFHWNEPYLRMFYFPLKLLFQILPSLMPPVVRRVVERDAAHREGDGGHLFARVMKHS